MCLGSDQGAWASGLQQEAGGSEAGRGHPPRALPPPGVSPEPQWPRSDPIPPGAESPGQHGSTACRSQMPLLRGPGWAEATWKAQTRHPASSGVCVSSPPPPQGRRPLLEPLGTCGGTEGREQACSTRAGEAEPRRAAARPAGQARPGGAGAGASRAPALDQESSRRAPGGPAHSITALGHPLQDLDVSCLPQRTERPLRSRGHPGL